MRAIVLLAIAGLAVAQPPDPAYPALSKAYEALKTRDYDTAISGFLKGIEAAPARASIRKDLAYTYLKVGENILARDQFREAMTIDPTDTQVAMEFAFLCYETKEQAQARRIFDSIRRTGNAVAEKAFQNIDAPLSDGIARWQRAIEMGADNFSTHFELATLAEQRDELPLAAEHYEKAWRQLPDRRSVLVDLGRVLKAMHEEERANAALLAARFGGETRAAEMARELLPERYPFVPEFRKALELDPKNVDLRRELGYLLLRMDLTADAEKEFRNLAEPLPGDPLSITQLGFLLYARGERDAAMTFFDRVLAAKNEELSNRVRAVLRMEQVVTAVTATAPTTATAAPLSNEAQKEATIKARAMASNEAKAMAERSLKAGYLKDALKYLEQAQEADPEDYSVMLKLAWTNNILHNDLAAFHWFGLARRSSNPKIADEASQAYKNLRPSQQFFTTTAWFYPLFSSRWHDLFGYAQVKTEMRAHFGLIPYASVRFVGDTRETVGANAPGAPPQYLSQSSFIVGAGIRTVPWQGITGWFEAGSAMSYLNGHMLPDYRGGISVARGAGHTLGGESPGIFADTTLDAIFVSQFANDSLVYSQSRIGYTIGPPNFRAQLYVNANTTIDAQRQPWANFVETGPGIRVHSAAMPKSMYVTVNMLRGAYLINQGNPRRPNFNDLRVGVWYAVTH